MPRDNASPTADNTLGATDASISGITVTRIDGAGLEHAIASQRGHVVLVDFWATWCPACVEGFPHTVAVHQRYGEHGLVVLGVSFDEPEDLAKVTQFVRTQGARFANYVSRDGGSLATYDAFQIDGGLPCLRLYDQRGELRQQWDGLIDPVEIDLAIRQLIDRVPTDF